MNMQNPQHIIVAMPDRLGDTLFQTQTVRLLHNIFPAANIDAIAPTSICAQILQRNPYLRHLYAQPSNAELDSIKDQYDLAIDISDSPVSSVQLHQINAQLIEYQVDHSVQLETAEKAARFISELFAYDLASFARGYDLPLMEDDYLQAKNLLLNSGINLEQDILIGFHMGCMNLARKRTRLWGKFRHLRAWPIKNFIKLAKQLQRSNPRIKFVLTGSNQERLLANKFCAKIKNTVNLIDKTSINSMAALMHYLRLFLSNDTGAVHIACTTNTNLVTLFIDTYFAVSKPYPATPNRIVLHKPKINQIKVGHVFDCINQLLF